MFCLWQQCAAEIKEGPSFITYERLLADENIGDHKQSGEKQKALIKTVDH